jgi:branched-chain amino acid transport system substrate-binding protein
VLAVAAALATGCASGDTPATDDGGPIYISVLADITGKGAFFGEAISKAATFSVDRINSSGGIAGRQIEVSIEDTTSDPGRAASLMTDAAGGDADAVVFGVLSEEALTIAPLAQDAGIPMIAIQAAANGVVETGDQIWRITPPQGNFYPTYAQYLAKQRAVRTAAFFYVTDNAPSVSLGTEVGPKAFADAGIQVVDSVSSTSTETDLTTATARLLANKPDHIQSQAIGAQNIALITQLRRAGFTGSIGGGTSMGAGALSALPGSEGDGIVYYSSFVGSDQLPYQSGKTFVQEFQSAVGIHPNTFHAETHDAFALIQQAVTKSGDVSRAGIKTGMEQVAAGGGFAAAQADPLTFENRDARSAGVVIEWKGGRETLAPAGSGS